MASPTKIIEQLWERKQGFENDVVQCDFDISAVQNKLTKLKSERLDGLIDDGVFLAQRATLKAELESLQVLFGLKRQLAAHALDGIEDVTAEIAASKAKKSIAVLNKSFERLDGAAQELIASLLEYDTLRQALYIQTGCRGIDSSCLYSEILAKILLSIREESHASRDRLSGVRMAEVMEKFRVLPPDLVQMAEDKARLSARTPKTEELEGSTNE